MFDSRLWFDRLLGYLMTIFKFRGNISLHEKEAMTRAVCEDVNTGWLEVSYSFWPSLNHSAKDALLRFSCILVSSTKWLTVCCVRRIQEPFAHFDALYDKPWTRLGPYLVGMATGWLLHETRCTLKMPTVSQHLVFRLHIGYRHSYCPKHHC
jgi:hypothetical protein